MTIARVSAGSFTNGFNAALTAVAGSYSVGDGLLLVTGELMGSNTLTTPSGWTALSDAVNAAQTMVYGKIAASTSETIPTVSWGNQWSWAIVLAYSGLDASLTAAFTAQGRQTNQTTNVQGGAGSRTPSANNSLALFVGNKNKTSASDGTTFTAPANFSVVAQQAANSARPAVVICEWLQTTATVIPANTGATGSIADATVQAAQGTLLGILASVATVITPTRALLGVGT